MKSEDMLEEQVSQIMGINGSAVWDKMPLFCEPIHYHPDSIMIL